MMPSASPARSPAIVRDNRVGQHRCRRVPAAIVDHHGHVVRGEHLERRRERRLRECVGIDAEKEWPVDRLRRAILADGLRDRDDVILVERAGGRRAAMTRCAERHALRGRRGIGMSGEVCGDEARHVDQHAFVRGLSCFRARSHSRMIVAKSAPRQTQRSRTSLILASDFFARFSASATLSDTARRISRRTARPLSSSASVSPIPIRRRVRRRVRAAAGASIIARCAPRRSVHDSRSFGRGQASCLDSNAPPIRGRYGENELGDAHAPAGDGRGARSPARGRARAAARGCAHRESASARRRRIRSPRRRLP